MLKIKIKSILNFVPDDDSSEELYSEEIKHYITNNISNLLKRGCGFTFHTSINTDYNINISYFREGHKELDDECYTIEELTNNKETKLIKEIVGFQFIDEHCWIKRVFTIIRK